MEKIAIFKKFGILIEKVIKRFNELATPIICLVNFLLNLLILIIIVS